MHGQEIVRGQELFQYVAACQNMSGVIIAVTLTGFIFLVTRAAPTTEGAPVNQPGPRVAVMGPFCLLLSFILGLASFIIFSVMSRVPESRLAGEGEFFRRLSPFHLMSMVLFLSMALLAFGIYYVTRDWLSTPELSASPRRSKEAVLGTAYIFALFGPVLVFFYFIITIAGLWRKALIEPFGPWGIAYVVSAATISFVFMAPVARLFAGRIQTPTRFMRATLVATFVFAVVQLGQNILWEAKVLIWPLELTLVVFRTALVAFAVTVLFHFIREDYHDPHGLKKRAQ